MRWKIQNVLLVIVMYALMLATVLAVVWAIVPARAETGAVAIGDGTMRIDLTGLAQAIIAVLCALVTHRLIPWIQANTTQKQQGMLQAAIETAVYAAQQLYKTKVITDRLEYAERWLHDHGWECDRTQIEAVVKQLNNREEFFECEMEM